MQVLFSCIILKELGKFSPARIIKFFCSVIPASVEIRDIYSIKLKEPFLGCEILNLSWHFRCSSLSRTISYSQIYSLPSVCHTSCFYLQYLWRIRSRHGWIGWTSSSRLLILILSELSISQHCATCTSIPPLNVQWWLSIQPAKYLQHERRLVYGPIWKQLWRIVQYQTGGYGFQWYDAKSCYATFCWSLSPSRATIQQFPSSRPGKELVISSVYKCSNADESGSRVFARNVVTCKHVIGWPQKFGIITEKHQLFVKQWWNFFKVIGSFVNWFIDRLSWRWEAKPWIAKTQSSWK